MEGMKTLTLNELEKVNGGFGYDVSFTKLEVYLDPGDSADTALNEVLTNGIFIDDTQITFNYDTFLVELAIDELDLYPKQRRSCTIRFSLNLATLTAKINSIEPHL